MALKTYRLKLTRDTLMFVGGAVMLGYETLSGTDRPNIIYAACVLMGVAAYLRGTSITNGREKNDKT